MPANCNFGGALLFYINNWFIAFCVVTLLGITIFIEFEILFCFVRLLIALVYPYQIAYTTSLLKMHNHNKPVGFTKWFD